MDFQTIEWFRGLDQTIKPFANAKNYNYIAKGQNFTIKNKAVEKIKSPKDIAYSPAVSGQSNGDFKCKIKGQVIQLEGIGSKLYKISGTTRTEIWTGLDPDALLDFNVLLDKIIINNGVNKTLEYDGTTIQEVTFTDPSGIWNNAKPQGSVVFANRLFYWGNAADPNVLYVPLPNSHNDFTNTTKAADAIRVNTGACGNIVGCMPFIDDKLIIYCKQGIFSLSGSEPFALQGNDPFRIREISSDIGCVSAKSIIKLSTDHYFVSERGLESLKAVQSFGDVKLNGLFENVADDINFHLSNADKKFIFSVYDKLSNRIQVYLPSIDNKTYRFSYDITPDQYNLITQMKEDIAKSVLNAFYTSGSVIDKEIILGDKDGNKRKIKDSYYTDDLSQFELHYYPSKYGLERLKLWNELVLFVETDTKLSNLKIEWCHIKRDHATNAYTQETKSIEPAAIWNHIIWNQFRWNATGQEIIRIKQSHGLGKSKAIKFRISNNVTGEHYRIRRAELYYTPIGLCKG